MFTLDLLEAKLHILKNILWSWPIVILIIGAGLIFSFAFNWLQIRYFFTGWKLLLAKNEEQQDKNAISPLQAFINALSASLGNGGLAGMATVLVDGGPGTMFWVFVLGLFSMILRFTEVYAGTLPLNTDSKYVGPFAYIQKLPFGKFFVYLYALFILIYILVGGNAMQCNSMGLALRQVTGLSLPVIGMLFAVTVLYITAGGARRIMKASQAVIPIKVLLFFSLIIAVIIDHWAQLPDAFRLILANALQWPSLMKGVVAYSLQQAITVGFARALNATEAGVGTAGIFFGATGTKQPFRSAVMSIITAFISTNLVCASLILSLVVTGVWNNGLNSTPLVIAAFAKTFGSWAAPLIAFLTFSFGFGVLVAYSFLGTKIWQFLFGNRGSWIYIALFVAIAFGGTISTVSIVWTSIDVIVAVLVIINVCALLWILPSLKKSFVADEKKFLQHNS